MPFPTLPLPELGRELNKLGATPSPTWGANFRTGETRGAKLEASTGEAKRVTELSGKEIQDKVGMGSD